MIAFVPNLSFLHDPHLLLWLSAPLLALTGAMAVARDHVFESAALSHAAILGIVAAATVPPLFGIHHVSYMSHDELKTAAAVLFAVAAALAFRVPAAQERESRNAVFAWTVLTAAGASCLLVVHHERAAMELCDVLTSTVLVAQPLYVVSFAAALAGALYLVASSRRKLVLLTIDAAMAEAVGMRVTLWTTGLSLGLGVVVGLSLRATGLLYTFGCLVLAPLAARSVCREIGRMFWVAPLLAAAASFAGVAASRYGLPAAPLIVLVQCLLLLPAWAMHRFLARDA